MYVLIKKTVKVISMDKKTKQRLGEIRTTIKKYGFHEILGQTSKAKFEKAMMEGIQPSLLDDEIPRQITFDASGFGNYFH